MKSTSSKGGDKGATGRGSTTGRNKGGEMGDNTLRGPKVMATQGTKNPTGGRK